MPESEATTRSHAPTPTSAVALEAIQRASQGVMMYGLDHPAVRAAIQSAVAVLREIGGVRIHSRGVKMYAAESCLSDLPSLETLCARLSALRIASLSLSNHTSLADIEAMLAAWGSISVERRWSATDAAALAKATSGRIECVATSYGNLRIQDGVSHAAEIEIDWAGISGDLVRVANGGGGLTATELASRLNSNLDAQLGGIPTQVLESAAEALATATPEERAAAEARLTIFFSSLSGDIRDASSRIDATRPTRSIQMLEELTGPMPVASVVANIENADPAALSTPDGVRLLAKLVWLSRDQEKLSGRVHSVLEQIQPLIAEIYSEDDCVIRAVDVLQDAVGPSGFTQADYTSLLESLNSVPRTLPRARAPIQVWTADSSRVHAVSIAVDLALDPQTPAENLSAAFKYIEEHVLTLAQLNALDVLGDAARAISCARERDLPAAVIHALNQCAGAICTPHNAAAIAACGQSPACAADIPGIFACCGGEAVAALIRAVMAGHVNLNPIDLLNHSALNMRDFANGLFKGDPRMLLTIASLEGVTVERRARLAHAMLVHDSADYRLAGYQAFFNLYSRWPASLISHALGEDDPRICRIGLKRLDHDPANLRAARIVLAGGMGFEPDSDLFDSGVLALERRGATAELHELSAALLKKPTPIRLMRAARALIASKRSARKCA